MPVNPEPDYSELPEALRLILDAVTKEIDDLFDQLIFGLSIDRWRRSMQELLSKYHIASYMTGSGITELSQSDYERILTRLAMQYDYLENFANVMKQTQADYDSLPEEERLKLPNPLQRYQGRARLYGTYAKAFYWEGETGDLALPAMPGDGTSQCLSGCRCAWSIVPIDEVKGDYDAYWRLGKAEHCQTCLVRAKRWNPLRIRDWRVNLPGQQVLTDNLGEELDNDLSSRPNVRFGRAVGAMKEFISRLKHLAGQHNQKRHGWRYGSESKIERGMSAEDYSVYNRRYIHGGGDIKSHRRKLESVLREKYPGQEDIDMVVDVLLFDENSFRKHIKSMGLSDKFSEDFITRIFRQKKEAERRDFVKRLNDQKRNSYKHGSSLSEKWEDGMGTLIGSRWQDAAKILESKGMRIVVEGDRDSSEIHQSLSYLANLSEKHPVIREFINRGVIKSIVYKPGKAPNGTATADANITGTIQVYEPLTCTSTAFIHEIGHQVREHYKLKLPIDTLAGKHTVSTYKPLDPEEQFAEWFTAISGEYDIPGIKKWNPKAYRYMLDNVPELNVFVEGL